MDIVIISWKMLFKPKINMPHFMNVAIYRYINHDGEK